ncbi:quinone-dependent dihydroorotate dehydrogenase [Thermus thermamylovorans]|uniref:Dihydroorotate dehydrogenase (quinone) n=1 Tax=Thermus thermamylovorans TaxID=2509362 RepID=A0A4Q9AXH9_9DEIN|nr:quinone-dependent dihydroorotate dehydrogenase [Thermus thermamylovorans]TBH16048.1 quinone-dependent dihydroorotate dehydrogenase [Thermus thermamylovorans]
MHRLLFALDPETAHERTLGLLASWSERGPLLEVPARFLRVEDPRLRVEALGLAFPNPLGLAAGMDKDAKALGAWWALGFGFAEVGTLTPKAQEGNPRPRLFRLVEDHALINRMGFNNGGAEEAARRLKRFRERGLAFPVGVNLGKNRDTPLEGAAEDYLRALRVLEPYGDYFVLNVSSPNTPGLRTLQEGPFLDELLHRLRPATRKPLLLKLAPDLTPEALDQVVALAQKHRLEGLVAVNTTTGREGLQSPLAREAGGLSGRPLKGRALEVLRHLAGAEGLTLVSVGGVEDARDVWERLRLGARLVQVYTGFVYGGPLFPHRVLRDLLRLMEAEGVENLQELWPTP